MPRARIPYGELEKAIREQYPEPLYLNHEIIGKGFIGGFTPIRVYDRQTGNYKAVGWKLKMQTNRFIGEYDNFLQPIYFRSRQTVVIFLD